jgi:hypothetical protein
LIKIVENVSEKSMEELLLFVVQQAIKDFGHKYLVHP